MVVRSLLTLLGYKGDDKALKRYGNALKSVIGLAKIGIVATIGLGTAALKTAGDMEQVEIAFETMLGSAERANQLVQEITKFAATTPFELQGLVQSSKQLLAFGFAAEDIIPTMTTLGNIAAGVGRERLPSIVRALGKIRTKGRASMEELNMMLEAGVPILDQLSENLGVTSEELFKMISRGRVTFAEVNQALTDMGRGTGQFANLMEKQSRSFLGILSNIGDFFTNFMAAVGKELLPIARELGRAFLGFLEASKDIMKSGLVEFIKGLIFVIVFLVRFVQRLVERFGGVEKAFDAWRKITQGAGRIIMKIVKALGRAIVFVADAVADVIDFFGGWEKVSAGVGEALSVIADVVGRVIQVLGFLAGIVIRVVGGALKILFDLIESVVNAFIDFGKMVDQIIAFLVKAWDEFIKFFIGVWQGVVNFFRRAVEIIVKLWTSFTQFWDNLWKGLAETALGVWDAIVGGIRSAWENVVGFITGLWQGLMDFVKGVMDVAKGIGEFFGGPSPLDVGRQRAAEAASARGGTTNTFDIKAPINLNVPEGTTPEQVKEVQNAARDATMRTWETILSGVKANVPEGAF